MPALSDARLHGAITVFLDRDGTLNHDHGYVTRPEDLWLFDGVVKAIARLKTIGSRVVLVTNQSAIGRGMMTEADLRAIHRRLETILADGGAGLDGMFFCPHRPDEGCRCRKPNPGMIEEAVAVLGIDMRHSYLVGDKSIDMELADRVGAVGVLVKTSSFSQEALVGLETGNLRAASVAENLTEAVDWIIKDARGRGWT